MLECPVECAKEILCSCVTYTTAVTPHIFENERRETLARSAESYWGMHGNLKNRPLKCAVGAPEIYGSSKKVATSHTASTSLNMLRGIFPGSLISRFGDIFGLYDLQTSRSPIN